MIVEILKIILLILLTMVIIVPIVFGVLKEYMWNYIKEELYKKEEYNKLKKNMKQRK